MPPSRSAQRATVAMSVASRRARSGSGVAANASAPAISTPAKSTLAIFRVASSIGNAVVVRPGLVRGTGRSRRDVSDAPIGTPSMTQMIRSAEPPSRTNRRVPLSRYRSPFRSRRRGVDAPSAPISSSGSEIVAWRLPSAIGARYWACCPSVPARSISDAAQRVDRKGPGRQARPISSATGIRSTRLNPSPPTASGKSSPIHPWSAISRQRASSIPVSVAIKARTRSGGQARPSRSRADRCSSFCALVKSKSMGGSPQRKVEGKRVALIAQFRRNSSAVRAPVRR